MSNSAILINLASFPDHPDQVSVLVSGLQKHEETLTLNCTADGRPTPSIQWKKNGTAISSETKTSLVMVLNYEKDDGEYRCLANNAYGSKESDIVTVYVHCKCIISEQCDTINAH